MKLYILLLVFIASNGFAQESNDDSLQEDTFQLTVSFSPTLQFFTDNKDRICGNSISVDFPALTFYFDRVMLSITGVYGSGSSNTIMTANNKNFTTPGGYLDFFQYKIQGGYVVFHNKSFLITPYAGLAYSELFGEKDPADKTAWDNDYNTLHYFPSYTVGVMINYDLTSGSAKIIGHKPTLRHFIRLHIGYGFLDSSGILQGGDISGVKEIGIGWGFSLNN